MTPTALHRLGEAHSVTVCITWASLPILSFITECPEAELLGSSDLVATATSLDIQENALLDSRLQRLGWIMQLPGAKQKFHFWVMTHLIAMNQSPGESYYSVQQGVLLPLLQLLSVCSYRQTKMFPSAAYEGRWNRDDVGSVLHWSLHSCLPLRHLFLTPYYFSQE